MPDTTPVLTPRALNRALLARQRLLERARLEPLAAVRHLVGQQAQNPHDPYLGLAARLDGFDPASLSRAIERRGAVRIGLLRTTLHLVTADDAVAMWPILREVLARTWTNTPFRKDLHGVDLRALLDAARAFVADEPRSAPEIGAHLARRWPGRAPASLASAARYHLPIVQVPPRGLWGRTGRPRWQLLDTWVGGAPEGDGLAAGVDDLVLRYLTAFGPASAADVATWSWLTGVREVLDRLRPRLRIVRDEDGRELWDVPDGPLPDPDTHAPPRLLPEYDNLLLSHRDRSRVIPSGLAGRVSGFVGTFLVDGFVAGQWRMDVAREAATIVLDPFLELTPLQRDELVSEGERLMTIQTPDQPRRGVVFGTARLAPRSRRRSAEAAQDS